ncbi:preprotein translocase subunit SecG [Aerococcaceae bacterium WGS1372]
MYQVLLTALIIVAILMIIFVIMQPSKGNAASMLSGSDDGQPKTKARGFEVFLIRGTTVLGILFFVLTLTLAYMSSK